MVNTASKRGYSGKKYRISSLSAYFIPIYISTLSLWPFLLGDNNFPRIIFYIIISVGFASFFIDGRCNNLTILFPFFIYYLFVILSALFGNSSIKDLYSYMVLSMSFFATLFALGRVKIITILKLNIFLSIMVSLMAIYEKIENAPILSTIGPRYIFNGNIMNRATVFADSPLSLGVLLGIFAIISFYMYKCEKKKIYIIIFSINILALLSTFSRGPLVSTIVGVAVLNTLYEHAIAEKDRKKTLKIIIIEITIAIGLGLFLFWIGTYAGSNATIYRIISIFNWNDDVGNLERIYKWKLYFNIFKENWFTGIGVGGVGLTGFGVTESGIIKVLVEIGIFGFIIYYSLVYSIIIRGLKCLKGLQDENKKIVVLGISLASMVLVDDAILQILESTIVGFYFWSSLAMICFGCKNKTIYQTNENKITVLINEISSKNYVE